MLERIVISDFGGDGWQRAWLAGLTVETVWFPDLNEDCQVDRLDLLVLVSQWLQAPGVPSADLNQDNVVDLYDFAILAAYWMVPTECN